MGCFGSRQDARRGAFADDWTRCAYGFSVGSVTTADGFSPLDKIVIKYVGGEGKELKDAAHGELADAKLAEDKAKELGESVFKELKAFHAKLVDKYKDGTKDGEVHGKYTGTDAINQVDGALKFWAEKSGLEHVWPEAATADDKDAKEAMDAMGMMDGDGEKKDDEAAEGGDDEKKEEGGDAAAADAAPKSSLTAEAFGDFGGVTDLPKLLTAISFLYPIVGDYLKSQVMHWELGGDSSDHYSLAAVASVVGAYVNAGEKEETSSFGSAWLNDKDLEELKEVAADEGKTTALVFPGIVGAWADADTAKAEAGKVEGRTNVIYEFKGKVQKPAGDKLHVFCRQFAKVTKLEEKDGAYTCTLEDYAEHVKATVAEYTEHCKTLAEAAAAAKEAVDAAKGGDDDKKDDDKKDDDKKDDDAADKADGEAM